MNIKKLLTSTTVALIILTNVTNTMASPTDKCKNNNKYHIVVNKKNTLTREYVPSDLIMPNVKFYTPGDIDKNYMEKNAARALEKMFNDAKDQNVILIAVSGYRDYDYQKRLYDTAVLNNGKNQKGSAAPNESEHRTGLAMDVTGVNGGTIQESFANTKEGKWVAKNSYKYGFIIRYPKDKTDITGYIYEPWHIRYVGTDLAKYIYNHNITLEEIDQCCYEEIEAEIQLNDILQTNKVRIIKNNNRLYISLRELSNLISGEIKYDAYSHTASLFYHGKKIEINQNGLSMQDEDVINIQNVFYVPLRKSCEHLKLAIGEVSTDLKKIKIIK